MNNRTKEEFERATKGSKPNYPPREPGPTPELPGIPIQPEPPTQPPPKAEEPVPVQPPRDGGPPSEPPNTEKEKSSSYWWLVAALALSIILHIYALWGGRSPTPDTGAPLREMLVWLQKIHTDVLKIPTKPPQVVLPTCPKCPECPQPIQPPRKKWPRPHIGPSLAETKLAEQVRDLQGQLSWVRRLERNNRSLLTKCRAQLSNSRSTKPSPASAQALHYKHREVLQRQFLDSVKCDGYDYILHFKTTIEEDQ